MSHEATVWAIQQRGLSPAAKLVLWHLADRFHPDHGCFPSQKTLAEDCEMSRASLNVQLDTLEKAGLIRREARIDEATKKQLSTRYRLKCERGFARAASIEKSQAGLAPDDARPLADDKSRVQNLDTGLAEPCPENGGSRVQLNGHGYNAEPVSEPVRLKKGAGAEAQGRADAPAAQGLSEQAGEEPAQGDAFEAFWAEWLRLVPSGVSDSPRAARMAWQALGLDDRAAAAGALERWVAAGRAARRNWIAPAASKYLGDLMWRNLPPAPGEAGTGGDVRMLKPWTQDWWAVFWGRIASDSVGRIAFQLAQAERDAGIAARAAEIAAGRPEALKACPSYGAVWPLWRDWLRDRGLRLPAFRDGKVWLFLPGAAPPARGTDVWTGFNSAVERSSEGEARVRSETATQETVAPVEPRRSEIAGSPEAQAHSENQTRVRSDTPTQETLAPVDDQTHGAMA